MNGKKKLKMFALCLAFTLGGACGDDLEGTGELTCQKACLVIEVGVECKSGFGVTKVQCGPDELNAAINCQLGNGSPGDVVPHCDLVDGGDDEADGGDEAGTTAGTTTTGWGGAWEPLAYIEVEPTSGVRLIDRGFFELVLDDLSLIDADATVLRAKDDGTWFIAYEGELCQALGLELLDELTAVNGHDVSSLSAFADAYDALSGQDELELTVVRGEKRVVLSYRVE